MKNLLAFFLFAPLVFVMSCQVNNDKPKETTKDSSITQTAQIQPNDKEIIYYDNGQAQFMQQYLNGIKHGEYKDWYKNGQLRTLGYFNMGMRFGTWQWYGEKGEMSLQVQYDKTIATI